MPRKPAKKKGRRRGAKAARSKQAQPESTEPEPAQPEPTELESEIENIIYQDLDDFALLSAIKENNFEVGIVKRLSKLDITAVKVGTSLYQRMSDRDDRGWGILHYLAISKNPGGWLKILPRELLLVDEFFIENIEGQTPFHIAVENNNLIFLKWLLENKPELVFKKDKQGYTTMHLAAILGHEEIVKIFIAKG
jgi:ankyrin repeat protein